MSDALALGQQAEQDLRNAGATDDDVTLWKTHAASDMKDAGATDDDIKGYFGMKDPDMTPAKTFIANNLKTYSETMSKLPENPSANDPKPASSFKDALMAGIQMSDSGLLYRQKMPDMSLSENSGWAMRAASNIGQLAGDLPVMIPAAIAGAAVSGAEGATVGSVVPGVGTAIGGVALGTVGAMAAGNAAPQMIRKMLMDQYQKGPIQDPGDFMQRLMGAAWEGIKGGTVGAATAVTGGAAGAIGGTAAQLGTELATMTTVGKALEGQLPKAQDFLDGAILLGGLHSVGAMAPKLREIYAKTGMKPEDVVRAAQEDPVLKQELLSQNTELPSVPDAAVEGHLVNPKIDEELADVKAKYPGGLTREEFEKTGETLYHGTRESFDKFRPEARHFFTDDPEVAKRYSDATYEDEDHNKGDPKVIETKVYGKTLDLTGDRANWPPELVAKLQESEDVHSRHLLNPPDRLAEVRAFEMSPDLKKFAEENGYGKIKAPDYYANDGTPHDSFIVQDSKFIEHNSDPMSDLAKDNAQAPEGGHLVNPNIDQEVADAKAQAEQPFAERATQVREENENARTTMTDDQRAMLDTIGEQEKAPKPSLKDRFNDWYANTLDRTQALRDILNEAGVKPSKEDSAALLQLQAASADTTQQFMEHGTRDFHTGDVNGEAYLDIVKDYRKEFPDDQNLQGLKSYGIAARTVELAKRGITFKVDGKEVDLDAAKRVVEQHGGQYQKYMDRQVQFKNRVLDYLHASGYFTPEQVKAMKDLNQAHFSFHRVQELDELSGMGSGAKGIKRIKGEGGKILDPILSTVKDTDMMLRMAEENRVKNQFVQDISKAEELDGFLRKVKPEMKPIRVQASEINKGLEAQGIDLDGGAVADGLTVFRPRDSFKTENQFETHVDGKRQVYETYPQVAQTLEHISGMPAVASMWVKVLGAFAKGLTTMTVDNPAFGLRHIYRNMRTSGVYSETGLRPLVDALVHAPGYMTGSKAYQDFVYDGGAISNIKKLDKEYVDQTIYNMDKQTHFINKMLNVVNPAQLLQISHWMITNGDNMTRFAEYQRTLGQGGSRVEAAYNARNVIPDYQKAGLQRSALWQTAAFARVHVNAMAQMFANIKNNPEGTIAKGLLWFTVPAVMAYLAKQGDQRTEDEPEWLQNTYETMGIDHWRAARDLHEAGSVEPFLRRQKEDGSWEINDGPVIKIPRAFTLGMFFERAPIVAWDAFKSNNPGEFKDLVKSLASSTIAEPVPTALLPAIEQATNYSFHTGRPIVSYQNEQKLPPFQYSRYTSESAKQLGKLIGTVPLVKDTSFSSPEVIDNYMRDWFGTLGQYALKIADQSLRDSGVAGDHGPQPTKSIFEQPFVREFFVTNTPGNHKSVEEFWHNFHETSAVNKTLKALKKETEAGNMKSKEDFDQVKEDYSDRLMSLDGAEKYLTNQTALIQSISDNPKMTGDEKRQLIQPIMAHMVEAAKLSNARYKAFQKDIADRKKTAQ